MHNRRYDNNSYYVERVIMVMDINKLYEIMKEWIEPIIRNDSNRGYTWGFREENPRSAFYWHCYDGDHISAKAGAYIKSEGGNKLIKVFIDDQDLVVAEINPVTNTLITAGQYCKEIHHFPTHFIPKLYKAITDAMDNPIVSTDMSGIPVKSKNLLIYSPSRYIVGNAYSLKRVIKRDPFTTDSINGILKDYSETELEFTTNNGNIRVSAQNFDDDSKWWPYKNISNKDENFTMYGLSINESIIDNNFTKDNLYYIREKHNIGGGWYGIYNYKELNSWGWPSLFFRNANTGKYSEVHVSDILRKETFVYTTRLCGEIRLF